MGNACSLVLLLVTSLVVWTGQGVSALDNREDTVQIESLESLIDTLKHHGDEVVELTDDSELLLENKVVLQALGKDVESIDSDRIYLLVSLADGRIVALNEDSGRQLWSIDTGSPLVMSSKQGIGGQTEGIFPSTDGSLYTYSIQNDGPPIVKKLPVSVKDLVDSSPSPTPGGSMVLGSQATVVFIIDVDKGLVLKTISGDEKDLFMYLRSEQTDPQTRVGKDFYATQSKRTIAISRKTFVVRSIHPSLGEQWNVTWSQLDKMPLLEIYGHGAEKDRDDLRLIVGPDFSLRRFDPTNGDEMWSVSFDVPPTVAYPATGKAIDLLKATKKLLQAAVQVKEDADKALVEKGPGLEVSETLVVGEMDGKLFGLRAPYFVTKEDRLEEDTIDSEEEPMQASMNALVPRKEPVGSVSGRVCRDGNGMCRVPVGFHPLVANSSETKLLFLPKCTEDDVEDCPEDKEQNLPLQGSQSVMQVAIISGTTAIVVVLSIITFRKLRYSENSVGVNASIELPNGNIRVGRLEVSKTILGYGSGGTTVYEGVMDGRKVAVKRMLKQLVELAQQEIKALIDSDEHPNVVRCFALEEDNEFIYLALERCDMSLADALETSKLKSMKFRKIDVDGSIVRTETAFQVSRDIAEGVNAVHSRGIVHRDLKPHNVLLNSSGRAKLSDMGLSKKLVDNQASFETLGAGGSPGWQAPEQLITRAGGSARLTASVDIFSSGMLIYYCLTAGKHPYGDSYNRDGAILKDEKDLSGIEDVPCAVNLISAMLSKDSEKRPSSEQVLEHPMWWSPHDRLSFLSDFSDRVEIENRANDEAAFVALESLSSWAIGTDKGWLHLLDTVVVDNLTKYRKYDPLSLRDLLRVVRNKSSHYRELPLEVQKKLGSLPEGFLHYFENRYPNLVTTCFFFALKWYPGDSVFDKYYDSTKAIGLLETCGPPPMIDPKLQEQAQAEAQARIDSYKEHIKAIMEDHAQLVVKAGTGTPTNGLKNRIHALGETPEQTYPSPLLPRKPWMIPCEFYLKTGTCKFGTECRFDHPPEHQVALNEFRLPVRPGEPKCSHFERTMTCKYGAACKYDHSITKTPKK